MSITGKTGVSGDYEPVVFESAIRMLAHWGLAHFGDRTDPDAYIRVVLTSAHECADSAILKIQQDLTSQGYAYAERTMVRMFDRFVREAEMRHAQDARTAVAA